MAEEIPSPVPNEHTVVPPLTTWQLLESMDFMAIEIQMVVSALFIIYVGAHASLRRPPSAAPPAKSNRKTKDGKPADEHKEKFAPGFEASDAIVFPLMAATVLVGLYYLIKWLQDPAILNRILRWYMSSTGVFSTGLFLGSVIQLALGFVFPDAWMDRKGRMFKVDPRSRTQRLVEKPRGQDGGIDARKRTPFPGVVSELGVSSRTRNFLFKLRHLLVEDWNLEFAMLGSLKENVSFNITTLIGCLLGIVVQGAYLYTSNTMLANIIGLAVCYTACQFMSVTSFSIGSLVLVGLFFYDIIMVFYTPFMVGVATQLDVPIKLTYTTAKRASILGLGDIVVPGIFICLALRFDLWKHYQRKMTREKTLTNSNNTTIDTTTTTTTTTTTAYRDIKAPFVDPRGQWGTAFWTTASWRDLLSGKSALKSVADASFPKPYFRATILGYLLGMVATVSVLLVFRHGQPALLYLVPGVVGSAYITGLWRGEVHDMWTYTEDGSLDVEDVVVEVDGNGNVITKPKEEDKKTQGKDDKEADGAAEKTFKHSEEKTKKDGGSNEGEAYEVLHFSITIPKEDGLKED
ncbi:hypothetical protein M406DRAFT_292264 [Cryphonectria parasitica EP155]|uniref:Signal peptide peptidase n=1 Tax=Cryphonectria parasitica (strain ATCC 38755 / EP155) TaxID=660469 RepID=A0A9P4Y1L8_CRYP1|nr:uncharacterized protein M406DRAFT_292264 [Cryphonectria parasitica EP155]KAF3764998.1 hypothetical protein M406DRAFT_292264 [Cryphonectria parasitica EP155]